MSKHDIHYLNHTCQCPNCFLIWDSWEENKTDQLPETKHCDYCKDHIPMSEFDRLERYFSIMGSSSVAAWMTMMPKVWKIIKEIKEKQNE